MDLLRNRAYRYSRNALVLAILGCMALSGCRSSLPAPVELGAGPTPSVTVPFSMPTTIAITGAFSQGARNLLEEQIATFEVENPDIYVEIVRAPKDPERRRTKLMAQLQAGDRSIDILVLPDAWLAQFASRGALLPLDDLVSAAGVETQGFFPAAVEASTIGGHLIALPWSTDGGLLFYRNDLLPPGDLSPAGTWQARYGATVNALAESETALNFVWQGAAYDGLTCNTLEFVWAEGGSALDQEGRPAFDTQEARAALKRMSDLIATGISPGEVTAFREVEAGEAFLAGDALVMRNWSTGWETFGGPDSPLAGRVGIAPLPASCLLGQHLVLSAASLHPEEAFRFMSFLVELEQQRQLGAQVGQMPALEAVYHDPAFLAKDPAYRSIHSGLSSIRPRPATERYTAISEAIYSEVNLLLLSEQSVEETASNVQRRLEEILQR